MLQLIILIQVLWGENAPGLFQALGEAMVPRLRDLGLQYGYSFSMVKTNTQLHGLPQQRMRTFYFFWRSATVPMLNYVQRDAPHLHDFLKTIPEYATMQDIPVVEGSVTGRFIPYQFVLAKENLTHAQFVKKYASSGAAQTISKYLEKNNLIDECIMWLQKYFPNAKWSTRGCGRTFVDFLEHMKDKLSRGMGYWDDSPKFMADHFTAVITKNVSFAAHPHEDRFFNIRELLHLMGMPTEFQVADPKRNWNHICQNVPVTTAADWAAQVAMFCRGQLEMTPFVFMKQDNCQQRVVEKVVGKVKMEIKDEVIDDEYVNNYLANVDLNALKEEMMSGEDEKVKIEVKEEPLDEPQLVREATKSMSFSNNFSNFVNTYQPNEVFTSPPKKLKLDQEYIEMDTKDIKPPTQDIKLNILNNAELKPKQEEVKQPQVKYKCGVCFQVQYVEKTQTLEHFKTCLAVYKPKEQPGTFKLCGKCNITLTSKEEMIDHWITSCIKMFDRELKLQSSTIQC